MPRYAPIGRLVSLALPTRGRKFPAEVGIAEPADIPAIADCLSRNDQRHQLAPVWGQDQICGAGGFPGPSDFLVIRHGGRVSACAAIWDQRSFKQALVQGYRQPLGWLRPLVNLAGSVLALPRLPSIGTALRQAYVSHLAIDDDDPDVLNVLLHGLLTTAADRNLDQLLIGLMERNPWLDLIRRRLRPLEYHSLLYLAHWPEEAAPLRLLDGRPIQPELALL
jgi:hypothetical protein